MEIQKTPPPFPLDGHAKKYRFGTILIGDWVEVEDVEAANRMQNAARAYGRYHGSDYKMSRRQHDGRVYLLRVS